MIDSFYEHFLKVFEEGLKFKLTSPRVRFCSEKVFRMKIQYDQRRQGSKQKEWEPLINLLSLAVASGVCGDRRSELSRCGWVLERGRGNPFSIFYPSSGLLQLSKWLTFWQLILLSLTMGSSGGGSGHRDISLLIYVFVKNVFMAKLCFIIGKLWKLLWDC